MYLPMSQDLGVEMYPAPKKNFLAPGEDLLAISSTLLFGHVFGREKISL